MLKYWYDGYRFSVDGESVYNPVSIGSFFNEGGRFFKNYWIQTGGMTILLTEIAKRVKFDVSLNEDVRISEEKLRTTDIVQIPAIFQKLKANGFEKDEARQYYDSLCAFYTLHNQSSFKVWKHTPVERVNVEFERLFDEIYAGMFEIWATGDLHYKRI